MTGAPKQVSQHIKDAVGTLITHALLNANDVDTGYEFIGKDITVADTPLGGWHITVQRVVKP